MNVASVASDDSYLKSTFFEKLVEHVFIAEVLQEIYYSFGMTAEVLRSEVDASGYDIVLECNGVLRHVQLKTTKPGAKVGGQNVNLAEKPSGCVVWVVRDEDRLTHRMQVSYLFFGDEAGRPLPSLLNFRMGKHTKANTQRIKTDRPAIRVVPKGRFSKIPTTRELVGLLFGLRFMPDETTLEVIRSETEADEADDE